MNPSSPWRALRAVVLVCLALVFGLGCSSSEPADGPSGDPPPRASFVDTGVDEDGLLDAPDSEYTVRTPAGMLHKSCPSVGVPNGANYNVDTGAITLDGRVVKVVPRCKYRLHRTLPGRDRSGRKLSAETLRVAQHATPENVSGSVRPHTLYGWQTNTAYQAWSGADATSNTICDFHFPYHYCKQWVDSIWGEANVPNNPASNALQSWQMWNAIVPTSGWWILQPVFQYDKGHGPDSRGMGTPNTNYGWWAAAWYVGGGNPTGVHADFFQTYPGHHVTMGIWNQGGTNCDLNTGLRCDWYVQIHDTTSDLYSFFTVEGPTGKAGFSPERADGVYRESLEVWNIDSCSEAPNSPYVTFSNTYVYQPLYSPTDWHGVDQTWWSWWTGGLPNKNVDPAVGPAAYCGWWTYDGGQYSSTIFWVPS